MPVSINVRPAGWSHLRKTEPLAAHAFAAIQLKEACDLTPL
jgi:hypothetical protein